MMSPMTAKRSTLPCFWKGPRELTLPLLLFQSQFVNQAPLLLDLLHCEFRVIFTAHVQKRLIKQIRSGFERRFLHATLECVMQESSDARVESLRASEAVGRIRDKVDPKVT